MIQVLSSQHCAPAATNTAAAAAAADSDAKGDINFSVQEHNFHLVKKLRKRKQFSFGAACTHGSWWIWEKRPHFCSEEASAVM
jgi:hypothetical protein